MSNPTIHVTYISHYGKNGLPFRCVKECTDWWDVADWIKERSLKGMKTTIVDWNYCRLR